MQTAPLYGIVIPVYNAGHALPKLLERIRDVVAGLPQRRFRTLLVDDGSRPPLGELRFPGIQLSRLRHPSNLGKGKALQSGFSFFLRNREVCGVITIDADLQHPPECVPDLLEVFEKGSGEIIIGNRRKKPGVMPLHRILSNFLTSLIISALCRQRVRDSQCGFRLYSRAALEKVTVSESRFHMESEILVRGAWGNFRIAHVDIPTIYNGAPSAIRNLPDTWNFITLVCKLLWERMTNHHV